MRKIFTLLALALTFIGVNAQETAIYSWQDDISAANSITFADGATITITGNDTKNISNGARITVDGTEYVSMKVSNGAENTYVAPAGKAVSSVTFYSYVNKDAQTDRPAYWKEVGGTAYDKETSGGEMMCFKDGANPDVRTYSIGGKDSFTFTNTGEQLCYVMVVTFGEGGGDTPGEGDIIARPKTNAGAPEDGGQYILVNASVHSTSWTKMVLTMQVMPSLLRRTTMAHGASTIHRKTVSTSTFLCQAVQATSMQRLMSLFIGQWRTVASVVSMDFAQVQVTPVLLKAYSFT